MKPVNATESKNLQDEGWTYVDVRTEPEFEAGHPAGSVNVPLNAPNFLEQMKAKFPTATKLVIGCQVGGRSARACGILEQHGYVLLALNTGGYQEWAAQKLPTAKGKS